MNLVVAFATLLVIVGGSGLAFAEPCLEWTHPGSNVNRRSLEDTVRVMTRENPSHYDKLHKKYQAGVITMEDVEQAIAEHPTYTASDKERVRRAFRSTQKQFWGIGGLAKVPIPQDLAAIRQTLALMIDTSAYVPTTIERDFQISNFLFGTREPVPCAVFRPAPGQLERIVLNKFVIEDGDYLYTYWHSEECSNTGRGGRHPKPRTPVATTPAPTPLAPPTTPKRATVPIEMEGSAPDGHTSLAMVWEVVSGEKGAAFLKKIRDKSSRELTQAISEDLDNGSIAPYQGLGNIRFTMRGMDWNALAGSHVGLNVRTLGHGRVFPQGVSAERNVRTLPLANGEAKLTIERRLVGESSQRMTELVDLPPGVSIVHRSATKMSCGETSDGLCGNGPTREWWRQVHELKWRWTRINFFVRRE